MTELITFLLLPSALVMISIVINWKNIGILPWGKNFFGFAFNSIELHEIK